jgi:hypothetical protein
MSEFATIIRNVKEELDMLKYSLKRALEDNKITGQWRDSTTKSIKLIGEAYEYLEGIE